jgi:hypothetical protein
MVTLAYVAFVLAVAILGGLAGILAHYWRAHATMYAEDLGLGEPLDTLTRDDYQWEKHVVGAEWDDAGFWAADSVRNLLYYMATGVGVPLLIGVMLWDQRSEMVSLICTGLANAGLNSPLCR